jgi:beta propeller repeat protein
MKMCIKGGASVLKNGFLAICAASLCLLVLAACGLGAAPTASPPVEYDLPSHQISDLSDGRFVSIGLDGEVHLVDIESGEKEQLTDDGHRKREAVASGEYVAWIDQSRQIEIYDSGRTPPEGYADDIFLYNLATAELQRITEVPARRFSLGISGQWLIWAERRNELREHYAHADIYSYDITTGEEQPVAVAPGSQRNPSIHGDLVVWQDNRNSPTLGTLNSGCGDCPDNRYDIYLYDFSTGREKPLVESQFYKKSPSIHENYVVWEDFRNGRDSDIYLLDLQTGEERRLTGDGGPYIRPMISGNHVIWHKRFACDVHRGPRGWFENPGVFAYNIDDGEVRQLSNYIEPRAMIHNDIVLIEEGCFVAQRIYSVSLRGD